MFYYELDEYEKKAEEIADDAVGEVIAAARQFAELTGTHYYRGSDCWSTSSSFQRFWWDDDGAHFTPTARLMSEVRMDVSRYWCSEAVEFAWKAEEYWNERVALWNHADELAGEMDDHDLWSRMWDSINDDMDNALDEVGHYVEDFIDSAECWYTSVEYVDELRKEAVA